MRTDEQVLDAVVSHYWESTDFNGMQLRSAQTADAWKRLLAAGLIEVVAEAAFPNPSIKPWGPQPSWRQEVWLDAALAGGPAVWVYPSPKALADRVIEEKYAAAPYIEALAKGRGQLEVVHFEMDAIEPYRNDSRYGFATDDIYLSWYSDLDGALEQGYDQDRDLGMTRAGYSVRRADLLSEFGPTRRFVCMTLRELRLMPRPHQQRMQLLEATGQDQFVSHPIWARRMSGEWTSEISLFDKVLGEIGEINTVAEIAWGRQFFKVRASAAERVLTSDMEAPSAEAGSEAPARHRQWTWLIRPTNTEWHQFVLLTDQMLSDSIDPRTLTAMGAPQRKDDGTSVTGTLSRLELFLRRLFHANPEALDLALDGIIRPLKAVRQARQQPAHRMPDLAGRDSAYAEQRAMLVEIAQALVRLRVTLSGNPRVLASGHQAPAILDNGNCVTW